MLRRALCAQGRWYASAASTSTPTPTPQPTAQAGAAAKKEEPVKKTAAPTPSRSIPTQKVEEKKVEAPKAPEAKKPEPVKEVKEVKEVSTEMAVKVSELDKLLEKQHQMLKRMSEEIEIARGERKAEEEITGETHIRDVPKMLQFQARKKAGALGVKAKEARFSMQEMMAQQSQLALESAVERRRQLSELNRENQLPWQKDKPKDLYMATGKWFLRQQQGTEAPVWMTAVEVGVILLVFVFWWLQARRSKKKIAHVGAVLTDIDAETSSSIASVSTALAMYKDSVSKRDDEIREIQMYSNEQSVTIDSLARCISDDKK
eukprot:TRINITY_DN3846_c5_g1_i1.p2 TRINITY_DN3846_c5_g1~~TRINITY_DN3846_c5_g1_i1.p2  ORF type:complete len:318 (+),score=111.26 TRINITY_DN3846_c5_g1_i1:49-1002(+)